MPRYDHVFLIIEENHGLSQIIGNPAAPNLNALARQYGLATDDTAVAHPSAPNYVAMLGGSTFDVTSDDPYWEFHVSDPSLMSQLEAAGESWKGYYQNMPYPGYRAYCFPVRCLGIPDSDTLYIAKHNGVVYFPSVFQNPAELERMLPIGMLARDLGRATVPSFSYIVPDECTDMHGAPPVCVDSGDPGDPADNWLVSHADAYAGQLVQQITSAPVWQQGNDAIVITFDEGADGDHSGCCGVNPGAGKVATIVITNHGPRGVTDPTPYNHYSLLATLQQAFGLGCLRATCGNPLIKPMVPLFATTGSPARPVVAAAAAPPQSQPSTPAPTQATQVSAQEAKPPPCDGTWHVVDSPNLSRNDNSLASVSASSPTDIWAVGNYYTADNPNIFRNLALHFDGKHWTALPAPNASDNENTLFGVAAEPSHVAWAVGYYADASSQIRSLAEYWDGSSWSVVPTANPGAYRNVLFGVATMPDGEAWAVGYSQDTQDGPFGTLVEHWDGTQWTAAPSANPGKSSNQLFAVAASASGAWAVGQELVGGFPSKALVLRWNGTKWRTSPAPKDMTQSLDPFAVTPWGDGALVVGDHETDVMPQTTLGFEAMRGGAMLTPLVDVPGFQNDLYGVAASGGTAWAVGRLTDTSTGDQSTIVQQLVGGSWVNVATPNPGGNSVTYGFGAVTALSPTVAWAVGARNDGKHAERTLVEEVC
jgi:hypothetical protein